MEVSNTFVVLMGIGTVFIGLICIVILCMLIGIFCRIGEKKGNSAPVVTASTPTANAKVDTIAPEKRREIIAAVSAALAEEMGTDISAIRIHSFRKI